MKNLKPLLAIVGAMVLLAGCASDNYPLKNCIVSDEALGSMGKPVVLLHEGTTVKFCCKGCIDDFKKDPAKYMAKLKVTEEKK